MNSLRQQSQAAFDISINDLPYQGIRGRGRVQCTTAGDTVRLEAMLQKYLAGTDSRLAQWLLNRDRQEALIEIEITRLTSWDCSGRMEDVEKMGGRSPDKRL